MVHITPLQRDLPITIQANASKHDLDACLLQHSKPIVLASKSLMDAKTQYANIEWELLTIIYACMHFCTCLYGCFFTIDRPQVPRDDCPEEPMCCTPHLQGIVVHIQQYNATIRHRPDNESS